MQFILIAYDGHDAEALNRRMKARDAHVATANKLRDAGVLLYGIALLNDSEMMIGSVMVFEVESREELNELLKEEPYVTGDVWREIEVKPCRVGPSFASISGKID